MRLNSVNCEKGSGWVGGLMVVAATFVVGLTYIGCKSNSDCAVDIEMVEVPENSRYRTAGSFPEDKALVSIGRFLVGVSEVTIDEYEAVVNCAPVDGGAARSHPKHSVSWEEAVRFCNALSRLHGYDQCYTERGDFPCDRSKNGYRLPSAVEFEYALRGDSATRFFWGHAPSDKHAVVDSKKDLGLATSGKAMTQPVKSKKPNQFGLYDLAGNLAEWTDDEIRAGNRIYRGGSWADATWEPLESAYYSASAQTDHFPTVGFRVVRTVLE